MTTKEISVIIPVCNEAGNLNLLSERVISTLRKCEIRDFEMIFIDDGSIDDSWKVIKTLSMKHQEIKGFRFSRNFGHQPALKAGLEIATGKAIVMLDSDLQHPPELISEFISIWKQGYKIVAGRRIQTKDAGFIKHSTSGFFYKLMNLISDTKIDSGMSDFRLLDRVVVDELRQLNEYHYFLRGLVNWTGYQSKTVDYVADKRYSGKTKYSFRKMISFAGNGIFSFSTRPLKMAIYFGAMVSFAAFIYIVFALFAKFVFHNSIPGWTSILISVLFLGGIQLVTIGIAGEYIGRLYMEQKKRPHYIISERSDEN